MKNVHIGSIIRRKLEESPLSIAEFASRIHRTRATVYDIFNRKSIDVDLLLRVSEVLQYNFLEEVYADKTAPPLSRPHQYIIDIEVDEQELRDRIENKHQIILNIKGKQI